MIKKLIIDITNSYQLNLFICEVIEISLDFIFFLFYSSNNNVLQSFNLLLSLFLISIKKSISINFLYILIYLCKFS